MPRNRPPTSGYARIAQAEEEEEEEQLDSDIDQDDPFQSDLHTISSPTSASHYAPIQPRRKESMRVPSGPSSPHRRPSNRRRRTNSGVDVKAINARLEKWADEIKERFTRRRVKGKSAREETLEIHHTVFQAPDGMRPASKQGLEADYDDSEQRLTDMEFDDIVESVRTAIELGMHPKLISQGSSGSYFARNSGGKVVGVFKPKDEEPYASKNPKWTKWIHRNLLPFAFGRACLIPNLSYVSEAAAYVLDVQLRTNLVPYTGVVSLSSKSFFYDFWDRRAYHKKDKILPEKLGSFQVFLKGFKGATEFFREHPWPDQVNSGFRDAPGGKRRKRGGWDQTCRPGSTPAGGEDDTDDEGTGLNNGREPSRARHEFWSEELQQSFREELEKLVILDYIMRNTDRGTDNWMIRIDKDKNQATIVLDLPQWKRKFPSNGKPPSDDPAAYRRRDESMTATPPPTDPSVPRVGAIDNSLSWPWKHPDAWRSYPFGWLFLPVSLIGRPFTERTRSHFLPLLTSRDWWRDTQIRLRRTFELDADFKERMFARQMAVMKGQAWNVVETLKQPDHGPLELTRRARVCVWDDIVDIPVAVPLTRPSEEMRRAANANANATSTTTTTSTTAARPAQKARKSAHISAEHEEMDISAAHASAPPLRANASPSASATMADLLGPASPSHPPSANPFNHPRDRETSTSDLAETAEEDTPTPDPETDRQQHTTASRPSALRSRTNLSTAAPTPRRPPRVSLDAPARTRGSHAAHPRRSSFATSRGHAGYGGGFADEDGEEGDGDLGYAAAEGRAGVTRKVVVERLEVLTDRGPVFSWC